MSSPSEPITAATPGIRNRLNPYQLLERRFDEVQHRYEPRDWMLYGLGIGGGSDPTDDFDLRHVTEAGEPFPTFAVVLAHPGPWMSEPDTGIEWNHVLHVGQTVRVYAPLHPRATVSATTRVVSVIDKGPKTGALVTFARTVRERDNPAPLAEVTSVSLLRANGGCGSATRDVAAAPWMPTISQTEPDRITRVEVPANAALLYRLSGDFNPIHAYPDAAAAAGLPGPILHGLATFGMALFSQFKDRRILDTARIEVGCRFTGIVLPGEALTVHSWTTPDGFTFRALSDDRSQVVVDGGYLRHLS